MFPVQLWITEWWHLRLGLCCLGQIEYDNVRQTISVTLKPYQDPSTMKTSRVYDVGHSACHSEGYDYNADNSSIQFLSSLFIPFQKPRFGSGISYKLYAKLFSTPSGLSNAFSYTNTIPIDFGQHPASVKGQVEFKAINIIRAEYCSFFFSVRFYVDDGGK